MSKSFNMNSLLDGNLDDLADKPAFKPFPIGGHQCKFNWELKDIKDVGSGVQLNLIGIRTVELANDKDEPIKAGDKTNIMLFFDHDNEFVWQYGQGQFKEMMATIAAKLGPGSPRELMNKSNNMEALFITGIRENKDKTQEFTSIEGFELL